MGITNLWVGCEYNIQPALPGVSYDENYFGDDRKGDGERAASDDGRNVEGKIANLTINEYKYGVADRGASIRIPRETVAAGL